MSTNGEQIFIVCPAVYDSRLLNIMEEVCSSIRSFKSINYIVDSVNTQPFIFEIPAGASSGFTLNRDLIEQLEISIAAIVFVDELRPNIAYELGFFHGQGKPTLLISKNEVSKIWKEISDLAGCALLIINENQIEVGIHKFLNFVYEQLSRIELISTSKLPLAKYNMLSKLVEKSRIVVKSRLSDYGLCIKVDSWGGYIFDVDFRLLPQSKFYILLRKLDITANYSIYFRLRFIDCSHQRKTIAIGLTSSRVTTGFESNERNLPSEGISNDWCLLSGSFENLLKKGQILGNNVVEHLEIIRVRAEYNENRSKLMPAYEIGYFEIVGVR